MVNCHNVYKHPHYLYSFHFLLVTAQFQTYFNITLTQTKQVHSHFLFRCTQLFKSNTSLTCQLPWFILKSTTLLSAPIHCTQVECSIVPLTFTVSICPFTDSVLGGAPLDVERLTVEREMRICNNIMGNKKKHYEHAINV